MRLTNFARTILCAFALLAFTLVLLAVPTVKADNLYASIRGTVTDASGAVVPDANLTATNTGTGVAYMAVSEANGTFAFLQLPVGNYVVEAKKTGFVDFKASGILLQLGQVYELAVQLKLGTAQTTVTVEASAVQVNQTTPQLGTVVNSASMVNMPLINRNWVQLQQTQPGVVAAADGRGDYATNGSETQQNSYLINGTDTNDLPLNTPLIIPSPDAIDQFQMVTNVINPEYGRNSGAVVNAITKSGTNQFHGDAFNFYRDTFLNGSNYFTQKRQIFHQNEFGGTLGGPIWKNHTFIFFSYQGIRNRSPQSGGNVHVFSNAEASDNFAADMRKLSATDTSPFPLFGNAESGCPVSGGAPCAAGTSYVQLFDSVPGAADAGMIPSEDINPLSAKLQSQFVPLPTNTTNNTFKFAPVAPTSTNQYMGRIDEHLRANDTLWGEWFWQHSAQKQELPFTGATLPGFGSESISTDNQGTLSWTHIINSHMLNELRGGYTRLNFLAVNPQKAVLPSSYCASSASYVGGGGNMCFNITPQDPGGAGLPKMSVQGLFVLGFSNNGPQPRIDQTYEATDNLSFTTGNHTIKVGFDMRRFQVFNPFFAANNGSFGFNNTNAPYGTGISGLDFLLGIPGTYVQGSGAIINARNQEYYSYFQDEYKIRPNLTLTFGTGWQIDTPYTDLFANNHSQINFSPFETSTLFPTAPTGVVFNGDPGVHAAGATHPWRNFGPRFGFAYSPDWGWLSGGPGRMSIRGGYGIYYNRSEEEQVLQTLTAPPFSTTSIGAAAPGFANPYADIKTGATVANPFPFTPPTPSPTLDFSQFLPIYNGIAFMDSNTVDPMAENFSLTVERQLPLSSILSLGYVGAVAHHLTRGVPINIPTSQAAVQSYCALPVNSATCAGGDFSLWQDAPQLFRYDPATYGPIDDITTTGNSRYNAFEANWTKHMSNGLQVQAAYTYSHSIDNTSGFEASSFGGGGFGALALERAANPFCPACDYGNSIFDARQRLAVSYVYQIPTLMKDNVIGRRLLGGWSLSGITTFQTGFPLDVVDNNLGSGLCMAQLSDFACPDVPNITGSVTYGNLRSSGHMWFDPSVFAAEAPGTIGNIVRNSLRSPGINNWDMGLYKDTKITEGTSLQLRIEFYNLFNHTQFNPGGIDNGFGDSSFGEEFSSAAPRDIQLAAKFIF